MSANSFVAHRLYANGYWTVWLSRKGSPSQVVGHVANTYVAADLVGAINYGRPHDYQDRVLEILLSWET